MEGKEFYVNTPDFAFVYLICIVLYGGSFIRSYFLKYELFPDWAKSSFISISLFVVVVSILNSVFPKSKISISKAPGLHNLNLWSV